MWHWHVPSQCQCDISKTNAQNENFKGQSLNDKLEFDDF